MEQLEFLNEFEMTWCLVGSRVTCHPPPTDTDQDVLVYAEDVDNWLDMCSYMEDSGWKLEEGYGDKEAWDDSFESWRKDEFNIILTRKEDWFKKFVEATMFCKGMNWATKESRIRSFDHIFGKKEWPLMNNAYPYPGKKAKAMGLTENLFTAVAYNQKQYVQTLTVAGNTGNW